MRKIILLSMICAEAAIIVACGNGNDNTAGSHQDPVDSATTANTIGRQVQPDASNFAVAAANGGMMEVELGKVAQENGASPRVKAFGAMMVKDHSEANGKLKTLAGMRNIKLPDTISDQSKREIAMMKQKTGKAFDKAYVDMMIDDHQTDIADFRRCADNGSDSSLKSFAASTLPILQKHLDSIQAIKAVK